MHEVVLIIYYVKGQIDNVPLGDDLFFIFYCDFCSENEYTKCPLFCPFSFLFFFFWEGGAVLHNRCNYIFLVDGTIWKRRLLLCCFCCVFVRRKQKKNAERLHSFWCLGWMYTFFIGKLYVSLSAEDYKQPFIDRSPLAEGASHLKQTPAKTELLVILRHRFLTANVFCGIGHRKIEKTRKTLYFCKNCRLKKLILRLWKP